MEAFDADVQLLPQWVQYWMDYLGAILVVSTVAFLIGQQTRAVGLYLLLSTVVIVVLMVWMHSQMGMVRLLGIGHVVLWTPLVIHMWRRLRTNPPPKILAIVMGVLMVSMVVALVFDYYDVARWLLGERARIV